MSVGRIFIRTSPYIGTRRQDFPGGLWIPRQSIKSSVNGTKKEIHKGRGLHTIFVVGSGYSYMGLLCFFMFFYLQRIVEGTCEFCQLKMELWQIGDWFPQEWAGPGVSTMSGWLATGFHGGPTRALNKKTPFGHFPNSTCSIRLLTG